MNNILRVENIAKQYDTFKALDSVSFEIPRGSIYAMLGPNGAGKTTSIRCITQILHPDSGSIYFNNEKLKPSHNSQISYMPEERGLYKKMEIEEQLIYLAQLKDMTLADAKSQCQYWLDRLDIAAWKSKKIMDLSKGMQQKIQFIATVINRPQLLILDEPFSGLDPTNAVLIQNEIAELKRNGTTIIFSTHRMEQVDEICDDLVLINKGHNILDGSVTAIKNTYKLNQYYIEFQNTIDLDTINNIHIEVVNKTESSVLFNLDKNSNVNDAIKVFMDKGCAIKSFNEKMPTIKEIFIQLVNTK
jgi:ABC-2 type transport system ATP-binding protein